MLNNLFKCTGSIIKVLFIKILIEQVQEQRNFIWSLEHLEEWVWRTASEETSLKKSSWRHIIRSKIIRSTDHQKHISQEATSLELTKDTLYEVYDHELCNHHLCNLCLYNKTKITVTLLQTLFLLFWNGFEISSS